jgi:hypothetical protein
VNSLAAKVRALEGYPRFAGVEAGRARYDHMGALLADAALQAAIDFNFAVKPRVRRLLAGWPEADTVARFLVRVPAEGLNQILGWTDAEKPARAVRLADLLTGEGVDTVDELRNEHPGRRFHSDELMQLSRRHARQPGQAPLSHLYGLSEQQGRAWPWQYDYPQGKGKPAVYWFEPDVAEMFGKARTLVEGQDGAEAVD